MPKKPILSPKPPPEEIVEAAPKPKRTKEEPLMRLALRIRIYVNCKRLCSVWLIELDGKKPTIHSGLLVGTMPEERAERLALALGPSLERIEIEESGLEFDEAHLEEMVEATTLGTVRPL